MKQEELLLQDLCARLPYGVKVRYSSHTKFITCTVQSINPAYNNIDLWSKDACFNSVGINKIKPYLFPLSSMTEEQYKEYWELEHSGNMEHLSIPLLDWLNANHFDYRGLIEKGLAIDATELNIY